MTEFEGCGEDSSKTGLAYLNPRLGIRHILPSEYNNA